MLVDDVVHPALAHALQVTRTSRPPGAVSVKEYVIDQSCVIENFGFVKERESKKCQSRRKEVSKEREKRERKGLELQFFPIATEKDDDKKIRMCTYKKLTVVREHLVRLNDLFIVEGILHVFV